MSLPEIHHGTILSGPYLIDDANFEATLLKSFAREAIGIEMEGNGLFFCYSSNEDSLYIGEGSV